MGKISNRRSFLKNATLLAGGAFSAHSLFNQVYGEEFHSLTKKFGSFSPQEIAAEEEYWAAIQHAYTASSAPVINLNNGGVCPAPLVVQQAVERYNQMENRIAGIFASLKHWEPEASLLSRE